MLALLKLAVFLFVALTVVFLSVSAYSRSVRRERLEKAWDADPDAPADKAARAAHVAEGMRAYDRGLRRRLIWLVYIVPTLIIVLLVYLINYS